MNSTTLLSLDPGMLQAASEAGQLIGNWITKTFGDSEHPGVKLLDETIGRLLSMLVAIIGDILIGIMQTFFSFVDAYLSPSMGNLEQYFGASLTINRDYNAPISASTTGVNILNNTYALFIAIGITFAIIILVVSLLSIAFAPVTESKESPVILLTRFAGTMLLIRMSGYITDAMFSATNQLYALAKTGTSGGNAIAASGGYANAINNIGMQISDFVVAYGEGLSDIQNLAKIVLRIMVMWLLFSEFFKFTLEIIERYFIAAILYLVFPMVAGTFASKKTSSVFGAYFKMLVCQLVLLVLNVIFYNLAGAMLYRASVSSGSFTTGSIVSAVRTADAEMGADAGGSAGAFTAFIITYGFVKICQKIDEYMHNMGLNNAVSGSGLFNAVLASGYAIGRSVIGMGKTIARPVTSAAGRGAGQAVGGMIGTLTGKADGRSPYGRNALRDVVFGGTNAAIARDLLNGTTTQQAVAVQSLNKMDASSRTKALTDLVGNKEELEAKHLGGRSIKNAQVEALGNGEMGVRFSAVDKNGRTADFIASRSAAGDVVGQYGDRFGVKMVTAAAASNRSKELAMAQHHIGDWIDPNDTYVAFSRGNTVQGFRQEDSNTNQAKGFFMRNADGGFDEVKASHASTVADLAFHRTGTVSGNDFNNSNAGKSIIASDPQKAMPNDGTVRMDIARDGAISYTGIDAAGKQLWTAQGSKSDIGELADKAVGLDDRQPSALISGDAFNQTEEGKAIAAIDSSKALPKGGVVQVDSGSDGALRFTAMDKNSNVLWTGRDTASITNDDLERNAVHGFTKDGSGGIVVDAKPVRSMSNDGDAQNAATINNAADVNERTKQAYDFMGLNAKTLQDRGIVSPDQVAGVSVSAIPDGNGRTQKSIKIAKTDGTMVQLSQMPPAEGFAAYDPKTHTNVARMGNNYYKQTAIPSYAEGHERARMVNAAGTRQEAINTMCNQMGVSQAAFERAVSSRITGKPTAKHGLDSRTGQEYFQYTVPTTSGIMKLSPSEVGVVDIGGQGYDVVTTGSGLPAAKRGSNKKAYNTLAGTSQPQTFNPDNSSDVADATPPAASSTPATSNFTGASGGSDGASPTVMTGEGGYSGQSSAGSQTGSDSGNATNTASNDVYSAGSSGSNGGVSEHSHTERYDSDESEAADDYEETSENTEASDTDRYAAYDFGDGNVTIEEATKNNSERENLALLKEMEEAEANATAEDYEADGIEPQDWDEDIYPPDDAESMQIFTPPNWSEEGSTDDKDFSESSLPSEKEKDN